VLQLPIRIVAAVAALAGGVIAGAVALAAFALVWIALGLLIASLIVLAVPAVAVAIGVGRGARGFRGVRRRLRMRL
jgi:hypothetical protein